MSISKMLNVHLVYKRFGIALSTSSFLLMAYFYQKNELLVFVFMVFGWVGLLPILDSQLAKTFKIHYLPAKLRDIHNFLIVCSLSLSHFVFC